MSKCKTRENSSLSCFVLEWTWCMFIMILQNPHVSGKTLNAGVENICLVAVNIKARWLGYVFLFYSSFGDLGLFWRLQHFLLWDMLSFRSWSSQFELWTFILHSDENFLVFTDLQTAANSCIFVKLVSILRKIIHKRPKAISDDSHYWILKCSVLFATPVAAWVDYIFFSHLLLFPFLCHFTSSLFATVQ